MFDLFYVLFISRTAIASEERIGIAGTGTGLEYAARASGKPSGSSCAERALMSSCASLTHSFPAINVPGASGCAACQIMTEGRGGRTAVGQKKGEDLTAEGTRLFVPLHSLAASAICEHVSSGHARQRGCTCPMRATRPDARLRIPPLSTQVVRCGFPGRMRLLVSVRLARCKALCLLRLSHSATSLSILLPWDILLARVRETKR